MMKIEIYEAADQLMLKVEGRLAGPWVGELEGCWRSARGNHPNGRFLVDLTGVSYIDQAGQYLLQLMHRDGANFVATGLMTQSIVNQITEKGTNIV
jgi:anti-anti-sigma regulatory factor